MRKIDGIDMDSIVERRRQGETWKKLAAEVGMTTEGLRRAIFNTYGEVVLNPKPCAYCGDMFSPHRDVCVHCGKPECYNQHKQKHWTRWDRRRAPRAQLKANEMQVECMGRFCGHKLFTTPIVNDHGRKRPLYRICPTCRSRNTEYCTAWGGY